MLAGLSPEDLAAVADFGQERFFPKGGVLLREGEPIPALYALLDGRVHLARRGRLLGHVTAGGFVGGAAMLARDTEGLGAVAETDTLAIELQADAALEIFEDHFPILHHVMREVCGWLIDLVGQLPSHLHRDLFPGAPRPPTPGAELDLVERILFLHQVPVFSGSGIDSLAELSRGMTEAVFPAGARLWEEGDPSGTVLLVVTGTVACATRGRDSAFVVGPGASMGAVESMAERPRWHGAVTETSVTALQGHVEGLLDVFEDNFDMAMDYLAFMARAQVRILESQVCGGGKAMERLYGCEDAPVTAGARPQAPAPGAGSDPAPAR
jgi:CRP-like cAMP-binding protein